MAGKRHQSKAESSPSQDERAQTHVDPTRARQTDTTKDKQERLERSFAAWVDSATGRDCMAALKAWYIHSILPETATDQALRHREGQRSVIGVIEHYAAKGRGNGNTG